MIHKSKQSIWRQFGFILLAGSACFMTYSAMYGFRKGFTVGLYDGYLVAGMKLKTLMILSQVAGYMLSKFSGIKFISELKPHKRIRYIIGLVLISELALLGVGLVPPPYNAFLLFFNGLPLGLIWGLVFSFIEGRRLTELLGVILATSFIIASGLAKSVGKTLMDSFSVSEYFMPFFTGLVFMLPLLLGCFLLSRIPAPSPEDIASRSERSSMTQTDRKNVMKKYGLGLIPLIIVYILLTIIRDFRDNFMVEIWKEQGYESADILTSVELKIALIVLLFVGILFAVKNNFIAFRLNLGMILLGCFLAGLSSLLFQQQFLSPFGWMILSGFGLYLAYIVFNIMLFERMIAAFKIQGNIGFLIYLADAFGYLGSAGVMLYKDFGSPLASYSLFFENACYITAILAPVFILVADRYLVHRKPTSAISPPLAYS